MFVIFLALIAEIATFYMHEMLKLIFIHFYLVEREVLSIFAPISEVDRPVSMEGVKIRDYGWGREVIMVLQKLRCYVCEAKKYFNRWLSSIVPSTTF